MTSAGTSGPETVFADVELTRGQTMQMIALCTLGLLLAETLFVVGLSAVFGGLTYEVGLFGWMVILPIGLGVGSTWFGERHDVSPSRLVVIALGGLFVVFTVGAAARSPGLTHWQASV